MSKPAMAAMAAALAPSSDHREFGSFRDPSGHLFWHGGEIYRFVGHGYALPFASAQTSGLYRSAVASNLLLDFETLDPARVHLPCPRENCLAILKPKQIPMVTYPYEWSFAQLKDAALATLRLHLLALDHGTLLKDASAFNIQFVDGQAVCIDHLSFDLACEHAAWPAYGQFCRHFLAPLLLMSYVDASFGRILQLHIDGPPLSLASKLLPRRTRLSPAIQMHLHLHARVSEKYADMRGKAVEKKALSAKALAAIAGSLLRLVESLQPVGQATEWGDYYSDTNYSDGAFAAKKQMLRAYVESAAPRTIWDLGGNNGEFSRSISDLAQLIVCADIDPRAVQTNYEICRREGISNVLPIVADLTNPPPPIGFANKERRALIERGSPDLAIALALIHHLAITNNLPLDYIARFLASIAPMLVIEFVPKGDSQVARLLASRPDIFADYHEDGFKSAFGHYFDTLRAEPIPDSKRTLYLMRRRDDAGPRSPSARP
jgi:hypothetical protein